MLAEAHVAILLTGALVGIAAAPLGLFLVLRGTAMLTDAVSHSIVLGIVIVWLLTGVTSGPVQMLGAALAGVVTVGVTGALQRSGLVRSDAAIGLAFPALFAAGILLINLHARDVHLDVDSVLLGEIGFVWLETLQIGGAEVPVSVVTLALVALVNLAFVALLWKELTLGSFDPALAAALGLAPGLLHQGLLVLTSVTAVASFDAVGAILFIAFAIVPSATALFLTDRPARALGIAIVVAVLAAALGEWLAFRLDVSIGGMMAVTAGGLFALALLLAPRRGVLARLARRRTEAAEQEARTLVAHLFTHEDAPDAATECTDAALSDHLRWTPERAARIILHGLDRGLVERRAEVLALTDKGRAVARAIFDPLGRG
ncbi:metal ABC transporter permease [Gemmobacter nectariphilus]|uniref:metal ABC transporter permease n=1 Tax=Gemmobacter nectariphilus TaxID=220343 RepID=UPI000412109C|nr:metal ABC transporter permease [Gemmobacter nectariphilus]